MIRLVWVFLLWPAALVAAECRDVTWDGDSYTLCEVAAGEDLRLFLADAEGLAYGHFRQIDAALSAEGKVLEFAMNAGMYHSDRAPVGLYLEGGEVHQRVITQAGPGNFGLLPNGVFCIRPDRFDVFETRRFVTDGPDCSDATQSGPMLVIDGALHPRFLVDGTSRFIRNGVGTSADGQRAVFAISNVPVNFHTFGRFFRDFLELPNALYFDGNISRLHAPMLERSDFGFRMGPIVGTVVEFN